MRCIAKIGAIYEPKYSREHYTCVIYRGYVFYFLCLSTRYTRTHKCACSALNISIIYKHTQTHIELIILACSIYHNVTRLYCVTLNRSKLSKRNTRDFDIFVYCILATSFDNIKVSSSCAIIPRSFSGS